MHFIPLKFPVVKLGKQEFLAVTDQAQLLRDRRTELGFTQEQVADMSGIKLRQYKRIENGTMSITECTGTAMMKAFVALRIDPFEFFPEFYLYSFSASKDADKKHAVCFVKQK